MAPRLKRLHQRHLRLHGEAAVAEAEARAVGASGRPVVVVSSCLLGEPTRYDGAGKLTLRVLERLEGVEVLPLCPELLGGMGCPRPPCAFEHGDGRSLIQDRALLRDTAGRDVTAQMKAGAERAGELARLAGAGAAVLKQRSPSCGTRQVHRIATEVFSAPAEGIGATAAVLEALGLALTDEGQ